MASWRARLERRLNAIWYGGARPWPGLRLLSRLYAYLRRRRLRACLDRPPEPLAVPVIVVGNLSVGGAGKTPLVLALAEGLRARGWRPGVVSRGYGRRDGQLQRVRSDSRAEDVGDEPLLLHRRSGLPVAVASDRRLAAEALISSGEVDLIIADDGLEHWTLPRVLEIVVIDTARGFGNGRLLPAGPLRAPLARLQSVDLLVGHGGEWPQAHAMELQASALRRLHGEPLPLQRLQGAKVDAAAGIAHPQRFFRTLAALGADLQQTHALADHASADALQACLTASHDRPCVITEKDAVKLGATPPSAEVWVLQVQAQLADSFWQALERALAEARWKLPVGG